MSSTLFSVAVLTYNQEKYIAQTLDSILSQNHNFLYEIVIGEDCSTDNTRTIIEQYAKKYPNIVKPIYNNPNLGLLRNYYNVISHCSGKYIMECAGDDYWLPGKVKVQIEFMEKNSDVCMCYGNVKCFKESKNTFLEKTCGGIKETFEDLLKGNSVPTPTVCFKKEMLNEYLNEINPLEQQWLMEDYPMWLYFSHKSKLKYLDETFAVYRDLNNSLSHSTDINKELKFNESVYDIKRFYVNKYNVDYNLGEDYNLAVFQIYFGILMQKYNREYAKKLRIYGSLQSTKKTYKFYCLLSYNILLWFLLKIILSIKKQIVRKSN